MTDWAQGLMEEMGYGGLLVLMVLENVFPPLPSEVIVPFAGSTTPEHMQIGLVVLVAAAGSVLGTLPLYWLGRVVGLARIEAFCARYGTFLTFDPGDVRRAQRWFERHGDKVVLLARCVPGVRSLISIPAGVVAMPLPRYLLLTSLGSLAWCAALGFSGRWLGQSYEQVAPVVDVILYALIAIAVVVYVRRLLRLRRRRGQPVRGGKRSPLDDARHPPARGRPGVREGGALSEEVAAPPDDGGEQGSFTRPQDAMSTRHPTDTGSGPPLAWSPDTGAQRPRGPRPSENGRGRDERPG